MSVPAERGGKRGLRPLWGDYVSLFERRYWSIPTSAGAGTARKGRNTLQPRRHKPIFWLALHAEWDASDAHFFSLFPFSTFYATQTRSQVAWVSADYLSQLGPS